MEDTIAAIASPPGQGAVALVRVSGPEAVSVVGSVFRGAVLGKGAARFAHYGAVVHGDGTTIDHVLATRFEAPASYTGEDVVEIGCHGGVLVTRSVLEAVLAAGCRPAEPGEFTRRAFLNGKLDLTQAEAVMDLISAQTDLALRSANEQLAGRLGSVLEEARSSLLTALAHIEAAIDFPDEDISPDSLTAIRDRCGTVVETLRKLESTSDQGRMLRSGVRTVICGAPNVGKSSLMNLLLGFDRAIVSDSAGTTRDTIEEVINLRGIPLRLIDTAGIREAEDSIEKEGISRSLEQLANADLVIEVLDRSLPSSQPRTAPPMNEGCRPLWVVVHNKSDLPRHPTWGEPGLGEGISLSCLEGEGEQGLADHLFDTLTSKGGHWAEGQVAVSVRHRTHLLEGIRFLEVALQAVDDGLSPELLAVEVRSALDQVGEIVGRVDTEEVLGEIFSRFCIGK